MTFNCNAKLTVLVAKQLILAIHIQFNAIDTWIKSSFCIFDSSSSKQLFGDEIRPRSKEFIDITWYYIKRVIFYEFYRAWYVENSHAVDAFLYVYVTVNQNR